MFTQTDFFPGLNVAGPAAAPKRKPARVTPMSQRWTRGERVFTTAIDSGTLLVCRSTQFKATNLVEITRGDATGLGRTIVYGRFVDPDQPTKPRAGANGEFSIRDYDLLNNEYHLAVLGETKAAEVIPFV